MRRRSTAKSARESGVDEPASVGKFEMKPSFAVLPLEVEAYPEPLTLSSKTLLALTEKYGSFVAVAKTLGTSEAFIRQKAQGKRYKRSGNGHSANSP